MKNFKKIMLVGVLAITSVFAASCGGKSNNGNTTPAKVDLSKLTYVEANDEQLATMEASVVNYASSLVEEESLSLSLKLDTKLYIALLGYTFEFGIYETKPEEAQLCDATLEAKVNVSNITTLPMDELMNTESPEAMLALFDESDVEIEILATLSINMDDKDIYFELYAQDTETFYVYAANGTLNTVAVKVTREDIVAIFQDMDLIPSNTMSADIEPEYFEDYKFYIADNAYKATVAVGEKVENKIINGFDIEAYLQLNENDALAQVSALLYAEGRQMAEFNAEVKLANSLVEIDYARNLKDFSSMEDFNI